jgi:putative FmdB family regulatory protein
MPIYAYRCDACGLAKDVLQKVSDAALTECPSCGQAAFKKQITAAGFQLKGTGWYVTDFRNNGKSSSPSSPVSSSSESSGSESSSSSSSTSAVSTPSSAS